MKVMGASLEASTGKETAYAVYKRVEKLGIMLSARSGCGPCSTTLGHPTKELGDARNTVRLLRKVANEW